MMTFPNANPGITTGPNHFSVIGDEAGVLAEVHEGPIPHNTPGLVTRSLLYYGDSPAIDSFGRARVSISNTEFDAQSEYGLDTLRVWDATANGTLSSANPTTDGSVTNGSNAVGPTSQTTHMTPITVSTTTLHYSILQSRQYPRYIPGKSHLVFITGIYATGSGASAYIVRRSSTSGSAVDVAVPQASWNIDPFDGTGPSGITLDFTKTQILFITAQWLGVGRVIVGFDVDGCLCPAHEFKNANNLTVPYTQTFNLPVRYELRNLSGASSAARVGLFDGSNGIFLETQRAVAGGTIYAVCSSVQSENGGEARGFPNSAGSVSALSVSTRRPVLSVRPRTTLNGRTNRAHMEDIEFDTSAGSGTVMWELVMGGTLTGAAWAPVGTSVAAGSFTAGNRYVILTVGTTNFTAIGAASNTVGVAFVATGAGTGSGTAVPEVSVAEFDNSATAITGGTVIKRGFSSSGTGSVRGATGGEGDIRSPLVLSQIDALAATQISLTLVCTAITGSVSIASIMNWHEQTV